jgi:hypothetical protein
MGNPDFTPLRSRALIPPDFARTGFHAQRAPGARIARFQVLGERSSGTNFVKRLLGRNSALTPTEELGWKHGFVQATLVPADMAVICVVRAPDRWALSMHARPWHCPPAMQALDFPDFIRAPWQTIIDRPRYFGPGSGAARSAPLQQDRDPISGRAYANLFALRRAKLAALTGWLARGATVIMLRMEAAQSAPETTLDHLLAALGQPPRKGDFRPVIKHLGSKFKPAIDARPTTPETLNDDDHAFVRAQLDAEMEAALGYRF